MPKINMLNMNGENVGEIELNPEIFDVEINEHAVYTVVKNLLANRRQGTQSAKTRAEVRGGGKKPWRQKGTGRARQGSIRSPQWKGGGVVFAPKPRDYSYTTPKKVRRVALKSVLTSKLQEKELIVLDELKLDQAKTKEMVKVLKAINADEKALVVIKRPDENIIRSARNLPTVLTTNANTLNVYDILKYNSLIITKEALEEIEEVFA
ncbi:50S ribosomal protein L4 [Neofamilia massiliensis]|uniref:50S ribosomal protein L4 n=1 Tax=Neofamilia massiliensis TaxID=1673724 RepID=UPI0006BB90CB|nr:50S ribosomal protein L4 [Neofamilia massiliensis]